MSYSVCENASLAPICSMKVGGKAKYLVEPKTENELIEAVTYFKSSGEKYIVVGNCSNLIFPDSGFSGAVITTAGIKGISVDSGIITAACGETLSSLARFACNNSLSGLEFCYGIPGTVGGGVYMNAGAYGGDISQRFVSGRFLDKDMNTVTVTAEEMDFGYRKSRMNSERLILLSAVFAAEKGEREAIQSRMNELMAKRKASQPLEYPNCGSAFKRPEGYFAGALIEECGLKGFTVGGARVSEKHAGFVINGGNATATEVIEILKLVSDKVFAEKGIRLEPEIKVIE